MVEFHNMGNQPIERNAAASMLRWYADAGIDEAIADTPRDRYAESRAAPAARPVSGAQPDSPAPEPANNRRPPPSGANAAGGTREIADSCTTLEALRQAYADFDGCALKETATKFVFADGNPSARLMLIGEAPGAEEDRRGVPFVGPAGQLLDRMLGAIGLDRDGAYITNILPWRPPGNRNPTDAEISLCLPFVERHIRLVAPEILVFVGGTAAKTLLGAREGIMRLRGRWHNYKLPNSDITIVSRAIFHPAYLLRTPVQKGAAWQDMLAIQARLAGNPNSG